MTTSTSPPARPRGRWRLPALAASGLLTGLLLAGGTLTLWTADTAGAVGTVVSGDLRIDLSGPPRWDETSTDVEAPQQDLDPAAFLARPGDTVELTQAFDVALTGDNMRAGTTVRWSHPADLPAGISAEYVILDAADQPLIPSTPVGTQADLPTLVSDNDGRTEQYTLQVALSFAADGEDRFGPQAPVVLADLGTIELLLEQIRTGDGATP
ncbi:MAG TPA: hypothetical protein VK063_07175 [Beutenbergiaceae bacterium]|nr:hypothetical protein [Beutenbergiaceae bacterium]